MLITMTIQYIMKTVSIKNTYRKNSNEHVFLRRLPVSAISSFKYPDNSQQTETSTNIEVFLGLKLKSDFFFTFLKANGVLCLTILGEKVGA